MREHGYSEAALLNRVRGDPGLRADVEAELRACDDVIAVRGAAACVITAKYAEILRRVLAQAG